MPAEPTVYGVVWAPGGKEEPDLEGLQETLDYLNAERAADGLKPAVSLLILAQT